jgi:hypothetical protein
MKMENSSFSTPTERQVRIPRVVPSHPLQHGRATTLCGHMQALADVMVLLDNLQYLIREILGVGGREPNPHVRVHLGNLMKEIRKPRTMAISQAIEVVEPFR